MQNIQGSTTYSQRRVRQLLDRSEHIRSQFNTNNFYEGNHINVSKLRQKILQAKQKLVKQREQESSFQNKSNMIKKQELKPYINSSSRISSHEERERPMTNLKINGKNTNIYRPNEIQNNNDYKIPRIQTDGQIYQLTRKRTIPKNQKLNRLDNQRINNRLTTLDNQMAVNGNYNNRNERFSSLDIPSGRRTKSIVSLQLDNRKIILKNKQEVKQFENKIKKLWQLYELIVQMMQHASKSLKINQKLVQNYINIVTSQQFQFIHDISLQFNDIRTQRTIRISRILQNFSVFQTCLNSLPRKKVGPAQIINYLGYSSSSVIFLIRILFITHETSLLFCQQTIKIKQSIVQFELNSYKTQLRNIKQVIRRLQHNNEIISMLKSRCGKKHGKFCEQFVAKIIKQVQKQIIPFYESANNIFQFLSYFLHYQEMAEYLPMLSTPPNPFLSLSYPRTIIIQPWGVLAFKKNNKLVVRAHTGKFLAQILDNCNLIFWTQLMPKDAQVITNLLPVKDNIYWLYRYHCQQVKNIKIKVASMSGCDVKNTIVIDNNQNNFKFNAQIGINMEWKGQKNDIKLLKLSEIIQSIFQNANKNKTSLQVQLFKSLPLIQDLQKVRKRTKSRVVRSSLIKYNKY